MESLFEAIARIFEALFGGAFGTARDLGQVGGRTDIGSWIIAGAVLLLAGGGAATLTFFGMSWNTLMGGIASLMDGLAGMFVSAGKSAENVTALFRIGNDAVAAWSKVELARADVAKSTFTITMKDQWGNSIEVNAAGTDGVKQMSGAMGSIPSTAETKLFGPPPAAAIAAPEEEEEPAKKGLLGLGVGPF